MKPLQPNTSTFLLLPPKARAYVAAVVAAGGGSLIVAAMALELGQPVLFAVLLALAVVTSTAKIELPLGRSQSNLSLSHAVNFWALFSLGPAPTAVIAAASAWAQCTLRAGARNPPHRVVFSIASLIVRCSQLGVISQALYGRIWSQIRTLGWNGPHSTEPQPLAPEVPQRMERMCLRAVAVGAVSEAKAAELLGISVRALDRRLTPQSA